MKARLLGSSAFPISLFLVLTGCGNHADTARPAASPASADRTVVDHADLAFELPGKWQEQAAEGGYDLRNDSEQVIVAVVAIEPGNEEAAVGVVEEAQKSAIAQLCKRGKVTGAPTHPSADAPSIRFHYVCEEPQVTITFASSAAHGHVMTYEHYRYSVTALTPELDRSDAAIFSTIKVKGPAAPPATSAKTCAKTLLEQVEANGGGCLEPAVLGDEVVADCVRELKKRKWKRDDMVAAAIGKQTGKKLVCYHPSE